jgi:sugar lactone lactonase YvrE
MDRRWMVATVASTALFVAGVVPASAQSAPLAAFSGPPLVVASGLSSPRHMAFGPDGSLYVTEAGAGGTDPCVDSPVGKACFGTTGSVTRIAPDGTVSKFLQGLPSMIADEEGQPSTLGPSAISFGANGNMFLTIGGGSTPELRDKVGAPLNDTIGWVLKVAADGTWTKFADMVAWESANNPDKDQPSCAGSACGPSTVADSDIAGVAATPDGGAVVADAGGNTLVALDSTGAASLLATFPVTMDPMPASMLPSPAPDASPAAPPDVPTQAVPTAVQVGPDGAYYVSFLTGFPFPQGGAWVARVESGKQPTVYASGFTNAMDLAFAPDGSLYVLEIAHNGLPSGNTTGGLWKVPPGGGQAELVMTDGLVSPGGIAVDKDGNVYVANMAVSPGGEGTVIKLVP